MGKGGWGHYWSWDPKETWAAITWLAYLSMFIIVPYHPIVIALHFGYSWVVSSSCRVCWWGINYLPSAQGSSVHTYSMSE